MTQPAAAAKPGVPFDPASPEIRRLQTRTLSALFLSAIFGRAAMTVAFAVAGLLAEDILGSARWAGASTAAITAGTALSASRLSSYMKRKGRRAGLWLGYLIAVGGALVAVVGGDNRMIAVYLIGLVLFGVGQGGTTLARYVAADLATPENRAKAIGLVVFASTIGAVGGPTILGPMTNLAERYGLEPRVGPFLASASFFLLAGLVLQVFLRPDPLAVSGELQSEGATSKGGFVQGLTALVATPLGVLGMVGLVVSQAVMVMVMAMTPLHMGAHGHQDSMVGWVLSAHTAGMFAFAPLAGWFTDRLGPILTIVVSATVLISATIVTALAGEAPPNLMFSGLFLLGLGWSFGMVASSALVTSSVDSQDQVAAQGSADVITSLVSGGGAIAAGLVYDMAGYNILSMIGILTSGALLVVAVVRLRLSATPLHPVG